MPDAREITLPAALRDVEPVRSVRTPARLDYRYTPGLATSRFLRGIAERKILGERCPVCRKVYVPPRGACPTDGVPTEEQVELSHSGTVTSFCVVNVQFYGQGMEIPYVGANILLDGSDLSIMHLIQEVPADEVRHRHAGRSGVGSGRGARADARVDQVVQADRRTRRRRADPRRAPRHRPRVVGRRSSSDRGGRDARRPNGEGA